jgi:hypothetical protein
VNRLDDIKVAQDQLRQAQLALDAAILAAYRETRADGTPQFTLAEIGGSLGVSRQRAYQLVRELAAREPGSRTAPSTAS